MRFILYTVAKQQDYFPVFIVKLYHLNFSGAKSEQKTALAQELLFYHTAPKPVFNTRTVLRN